MTDDSGYTPNFGEITAPKPEIAAGDRKRMRIAIMGDFSGRANKGELEIGADLARRKPIKFDVDTFEDVIERFATTLMLPIGKDGSIIEVELEELDALHPDELYENVELFADLSALRTQISRGRNLDSVIADMQEWGEEFGDFKLNRKARAKGAKASTTLALSEFESLIGAAPEEREGSDVDDLIQRIVAPFVVAAPDAGQEAMLEAVDQALSAAMGSILHHPDFQAVEANWRALEMISRRVETGGHLEVVLYDVAVEEFTADLAAQDDLGACGLYDMLVERPRLDEAQGPLAAVFGLYTFEETPPHAELMGRMAKIAAHMDAPFISAIGAGFLNTKTLDLPPMIAKTWASLREMPESKYVGLASPRFLLRLPYGKRSDPVDPFDYTEFNIKEGLRSLLLGNPAVLAAVLLCETVAQQGSEMSLGSIMSVDDMPFHFMNDQYGDQIALPSTERLINVRMSAQTIDRGYMPVLSIQGQNVVRLGSFNAIGGGQVLGLWSGEEAKALSSGAIRNKVDIGFSSKMEKAAPVAAKATGGGDDDDGDFNFGSDDDDDGGFDFGGGDDDDGGFDFGSDDDGDDPFDLGGGDDDSDDSFDSGSDDSSDDDSSDDGFDFDSDDDGDNGLDDLLAGFDDDADDNDDSDDDDSDMDDELAALLADL